MALKGRTQAGTNMPSQTHCGLCERGWVIRRMNVPLSDCKLCLGHFGCNEPMVAYPCLKCNLKGVELVREHKAYIKMMGWDRTSDTAKVLSPDLKRENVASTFYVRPSERTYGSIIKDKKELAHKLYGDAVKAWHLADWDRFDQEHSHPREELLAGKELV